MPIKEHSKKALRQNIKRAKHNLKISEDIKTLIKKTRQAVASQESKDKIADLLKQVQQSVDKAAQKGLIKKNNAARKISRLTKLARAGKKEASNDSIKENK